MDLGESSYLIWDLINPNYYFLHLFMKIQSKIIGQIKLFPLHGSWCMYFPLLASIHFLSSRKHHVFPFDRRGLDTNTTIIPSSKRESPQHCPMGSQRSQLGTIMALSQRKRISFGTLYGHYRFSFHAL